MKFNFNIPYNNIYNNYNLKKSNPVSKPSDLSQNLLRQNIKTKNISFGINNEKTDNITPSMMGININSVQNDMTNFQNTINKYSYGKKLLISNPENFSVSLKDGDVYLNGFYDYDKNSKEGICQELTYKTGIELQKKYGDKYIFFAVDGTCSDYNMTHFYISALKRTPENEKTVQNLIEQSQKIGDAFLKLFNNIEDINENEFITDSELENFNAEKISALNKSILIDPSFKTVKQYNKNGTVSDYTQKYIYDFEEMNPYKNSFYKIPKVIADFGIVSIPLGLVKDIAPDLNVNQDNMLFLNIYPTLSSQMNISTITKDGLSIMNLEPDNNHPLAKFLGNIQFNKDNVPEQIFQESPRCVNEI